MADLGKMSKKQLEAYARKELGVELDRRHSKKQLLWEVQELLEDRPLVEEVEEVEVLTPPAPKPKASHSSTNMRTHIEKFSGERRDCATIWLLIKDGTKYTTDEEVLDLIKVKQYETLLGEIS